MTYRKLLMILTLSAYISSQGLAQWKELSLDSCIAKSERNYPQIAQYALVAQSTGFSLENAQKGKYPQVSIVGQATYQSEVTSLPGSAGMGVPELSKDQYQLYGEVNQPLTGLAVINQEKKLIKNDGEVNRADLETKLYAIKERVSDLFFGILLVQEQLRQSDLTKADLEMGIKVMDASVQYGAALQTSADVLKAQLLTLQQRMIEQEATRDGYLKMLGLFIGEELDSSIPLASPASSVRSKPINRPELRLFDAKMQSITLQDGLLKKTNLPQLSLFLQSGFGRPALNFLSNDFEPYYLGGLRLSWNLSNFYTNKGQKALFDIQRKTINSEKETFLFNTGMTLSNQEIQISKAKKLIEKDHEIIALRDRIVTTSRAQLENGVITTTDYNTLVTDADEARQDLILHQVELLKLRNDFKLTSGN